jgi:hypothetical protein
MMRGTVPRGCRLLINGASLLLEEGETNDDQLLWGSPDSRGRAPAASGAAGSSRQQRPPSWAGAGGAWGLAGGSLVCELSWMRFRAMVDGLDLVCGIYVQVGTGSSVWRRVEVGESASCLSQGRSAGVLFRDTSSCRARW